jgi:hypothetical protein
MSAQVLEHSLPEATTEYATGVAGRKHRNDLPHLRLVAPLRPERASRGLFAVIITGMLALGLVIMLVVNTSVAQTAFTVSELRGQQRELARTEAALTEQLSAAAAPPVLEAKARAIGMVPSGRPVFVTIPSGDVKGKAKPAPGNKSRTANVATSLTASLLDPVPGSKAEQAQQAAAQGDQEVGGAAGQRRQIGDGAVLVAPGQGAAFDEATEQARRNEAQQAGRVGPDDEALAVTDGAVLVGEANERTSARTDDGAVVEGGDR